MKTRSSKWIILGVIIMGAVSGITAGSVLVLMKDLPQIASLENYAPWAVTRVFSADRVQLAELYAQRRDPVSFSQIPKNLITALLTTEDRRFYQHSGIAIRGIIRATLKNLTRGGYAEGASTITQQLAKTLFLTPRKAIVRKLREAVLAFQLEHRYTKNEILTLYLNQVYFGSGAYGASAAAQTFFHRSLDKLTLAQCAMLAGVLKAPSRYSPINHPDLAVQRRNLVLSQMHSTGAIDARSYHQATTEPLPPIQTTPRHDRAPYFIDFIKQELENTIGVDMVYKGGLTVITTLSADLQAAAREAVENGINQFSRGNPAAVNSPLPQAALVALDVDTGGILSMVGGMDYEKSKFNRAVDALRQPGSAFKPLVYAQAIESGYNQNQTLLDAPVVFSHGPDNTDWQPENFSNTYDGEVSLRWALAHSKNIPAVRLIEKIGPTSVVHFAQALGLNQTLEPNLSLALGTSEVTLLTLTASYAAFANQGTYTRPFGISEVRDKSGELLWTVKPDRHLAMSRSTAAIVTDMLTEVIKSGTGRAASALSGPLAGKTGTTDQYKDGLFIGYSPRIVAGVWMGNDDGSTLGKGETGAHTALPIWISYMKKALKTYQLSYFDLPNDVQPITIDIKTGKRVSAPDSKAEKVLIKK